MRTNTISTIKHFFQSHVTEFVISGFGVFVAVLPFSFNISDEPSQRGLTGWSSYGQWFGFLAGVCAAIAFVVANRTLRLQSEQLQESRESANETRRHMTAQLELLNSQATSMKDAAEVTGLSALIHYCERFENIDADGESKDELRRTAAKAKNLLKKKLNF